LEVGWPRRFWRRPTERWACTRVANGITTRVPFPLAHRISQRGVRFDAISCHEITPTSLSQFAHRCRICCNVRYSSLGPKRETRAKDLGSRTVATFFACTIPLCAEDFKSQHEEFMRSEHSLHQFLVWLLLIFHALPFANCGSQQSFSVITLIFDKFWNTSHVCSQLLPSFRDLSHRFCVWWLLTAESSLSGTCTSTNTQRSIQDADRLEDTRSCLPPIGGRIRCTWGATCMSRSLRFCLSIGISRPILAFLSNSLRDVLHCSGQTKIRAVLTKIVQG
jgi:hypothetical protein